MKSVARFLCDSWAYCTEWLRYVVGLQVDGALDVKPVNTAVLDGQSAVLRCHSNVGDSVVVDWSRRVAGGADELIVVACDILPSLKPTVSSVYSLIKDGSGQCDLVVNRTDTSLTGLYICTEGTNTAEAQLTIIGELLSTLLGGFTDVDNDRNTDTKTHNIISRCRDFVDKLEHCV